MRKSSRSASHIFDIVPKLWGLVSAISSYLKGTGKNLSRLEQTGTTRTRFDTGGWDKPQAAKDQVTEAGWGEGLQQ